MKKQQTKVKDFNKLLQGKSVNEVVELICGEMIGKGLYRDVYVLKQNENYVIKVERDMSTANFANVTEWRNYINNKEWEWLSGWLAPCELISQDGQILIQQRVTPGKRKDYPKHIPAVFTDLKLSNFGWIGERFVCCDYSFMVQVVGKNKMKYAKWWSLKNKK